MVEFPRLRVQCRLKVSGASYRYKAGTSTRPASHKLVCVGAHLPIVQQARVPLRSQVTLEYHCSPIDTATMIEAVVCRVLITRSHMFRLDNISAWNRKVSLRRVQRKRKIDGPHSHAALVGLQPHMI